MSNSIKQEILLYGLETSGQIIEKIIGQLNIPANSDICFDIRLVLTEALSNAFLHGNCGNVNLPIYLRYSYDCAVLKLEIEDSGNGLKNIAFPQEITDGKILADCGRGLFLIQSLSDTVYWQDNTIVIEKKLSGEACVGKT